VRLLNAFESQFRAGLAFALAGHNCVRVLVSLEEKCKAQAAKMEGVVLQMGRTAKGCEIDDDEVLLGKLLGTGSFGLVYEGECRSSTVAVKVLHQQELSPPELEDFRREIHIMA